MKKPADPSLLPYRSGVGLVLFNRQGLVFTARRLDTADAWQFPQGGIDQGETPEQAALRELEEEIGTNKAVIVAEMPGWLDYDLPAELLGRVWKGRYRGQRQKWFALSFTGVDGDISVETAHPEFDAWRWAPLESVADFIVPFKRHNYSVVAAHFAPLARSLGARPA